MLTRCPGATSISHGFSVEPHQRDSNVVRLAMRPRGDCRRTCCRDLSQSADSAVNTAPTHHYTYTALTIRQQRLHRALEMKSVPICRYSPYRYILDNHVSAVARSCNYHARAIRHVRHLLTVDLAQTLACSLILSKIDYCNAVLHGAPSGTIQKLQPVQNNAARVVLQAPRRSHATRCCRSCTGYQWSSASPTNWPS